MKNAMHYVIWILHTWRYQLQQLIEFLKFMNFNNETKTKYMKMK